MDDALLGCKSAQSDSQSTTKPNSTLSMSDTRKRSNGRKASRRTRMTDWEKIDDCMRYLRDEHRWTMEDLIHAYASTITEKPFKASVKVRSRKLAEAIARENEVLFAMEELDNATTAWKTVAIPEFRSEMDGLIKYSKYFGKFDATKIFPINEEEPWGTPEYEHELKNHCPKLVAFLKALMKNDDERFPREEKEMQRIFIVLSILCYTRNVQLSNCFQKSFGMHLHSLGTKRRLLDMFSRFGLSCSYDRVISIVKELSMEGKA